MLVLVECKDYSSGEPVNDLEEFWSKVQQVAGANVKGIFASTGGSVNLDLICEWQREQRGLSVVQASVRKDSPQALGALSFDPLEILLFRIDESQGGSRFTLAHELGHLFMEHNRFMSAEMTDEDDLQEQSYNRLGFIDVRRMEWQANYFASALLLPLAQFTAQLYAIALERNLRDKGFGLIFVDHQPVNVSTYYAVTGALADLFKVSRQATVIRLNGLGYLNDVREGQSASSMSTTTLQGVDTLAGDRLAG